MADETLAAQMESVREALEKTRKDFDLAFEEKRKKLTQGDELPLRAEDGQGLSGRQASSATG